MKQFIEFLEFFVHSLGLDSETNSAFRRLFPDEEFFHDAL